MLTRCFLLTALILVTASLCRSLETSDDLTRQPSGNRLLSHLHLNRLPSKVPLVELPRTASHVPPLIEELLKSYPKHQLEETASLWKLGDIEKQTAKRAPFWKRADELVKRIPFWKRRIPLVPRSRFWKRFDINAKRPSFWKRQSLPMKRAPFWKRRSFMKRPSFWKRSREADKRAPFWKRGQSMKRASFWKRQSSPKDWIDADYLPSSKRAPFWKRSDEMDQPLSIISEKRPSFWKRAPFWKRVALDELELPADRRQKRNL